MNTLKIEYDVYAKLFGKNLIKLNLTICKKNKISISIDIVITDHLDKLNSSSGYYNDICYITTSKDGTDISLKDRQTEFVDNNKMVCQENCDFSEYDHDNLVAKYSCEIKESSNSFADMKINKNKLLENFKNIKNIVNLNFLKCYNKLFNKEDILRNIGFYIIFAIIIFHIITIFIFSIQKFSLIVNKIKNIVSEIYEHPSKKENNKKVKIVDIKIYQFKRIYIHKKVLKRIYKKNFIIKKIISNESGKKLTHKINNSKNNKIINKKFIDEEMNEFTYNYAINYGKRTYCQYYLSLLKSQHNALCILFNYHDYNSRIIKINLFFIGFNIEYIVNALFYDDDKMHKIYKSKGVFDFETQIPIAVYSTIISTILNMPLNYLALSNEEIINFKLEDTKNNIFKRINNLKNNLILKFRLYFIVSSLFLLFFWYYLSMFGVIYENTQIHLLKDTLMSFALSLVYPCVIYLLPGIFRLYALSNANKKRIYLYNFSKFLQSF